MMLWRVLVALFLLTACGSTFIDVAPTPTPLPPCRTQATAFITKVEASLPLWDDTNKLANATSRISLSPHIARLQEIRRDVRTVDTPLCAAAAKNAVTSYMDTTINAYIAFLGQQPEATVNKQLADAKDLLDRFAREFSAIKNK